MHRQVARREVRRRRNHSAWIKLVNGTLQECQVWDVSRSGARLVVAVDTTVPTTFELQFAANTLTPKRCKVVWHHGRIFGVQFVG